MDLKMLVCLGLAAFYSLKAQPLDMGDLFSPGIS